MHAVRGTRNGVTLYDSATATITNGVVVTRTPEHSRATASRLRTPLPRTLTVLLKTETQDFTQVRPLCRPPSALTTKAVRLHGAAPARSARAGPFPAGGDFQVRGIAEPTQALRSMPLRRELSCAAESRSASLAASWGRAPKRIEVTASRGSTLLSCGHRDVVAVTQTP